MQPNVMGFGAYFVAILAVRTATQLTVYAEQLQALNDYDQDHDRPQWHQLSELKKAFVEELREHKQALCANLGLTDLIKCHVQQSRFSQLESRILWNNVVNQNSTVALRFYPESLMEQRDFIRMRTGYIKRPIAERIPFTRTPVAKRVAERYLNFAELGLVTPVKNQRQCGACYSFTAMSVLESALLRRFGSTPNFSEQQGIDCTFGRYENETMNLGCDGGHPYYVLRHAEKARYVSSAVYGYRNRQQPCKVLEEPQPLWLTAGVVAADGTNEGLIEILHKFGPVSVAVAVGNSEFKHYGGGIITQCGPKLDHAVVLVGYRVSGDPEGSYWIVKNSWGPDWGENGFARIRMGICGVTQEDPVVVIVH